MSMSDRSAAGGVRWFSEADVEALLDVGSAIEVLDRAYRALSSGSAHVLPRGHASWEGGVLHSVGGVDVLSGSGGVKVWTYTPRGASPLLVLFSTEDGSLQALIEARALGRLRTAATTGLGTRLLARADADVLAIAGTGRQALAQVQAVNAARPLRAVRIHGRDRERRLAFAKRVEQELEVEASVHGSLDEALAGAGIIVTVTRSKEPLLTASQLDEGVHVNAVGSITPVARELDAAAVARADVVVVDLLEQARRDAGELLAAETEGWSWSGVVELGDVVAGRARGRTRAKDVTLLRALGIGLADVAVGGEILRRGVAGADATAPAGSSR